MQRSFAMTNKFDYLVYVGRFQPFTIAHKHAITMARQFAGKVIILIGSAGEPRTVSNPFTYDERKAWIERDLGSDFDYEIAPIYDYPYNDNKWVTGVQKTVERITNGQGRVGVIGHNKDASTFYLNMFPKWGKLEVKASVDHNHNIINATDVRNAFYAGKASYGGIVDQAGGIDLSEKVKLNVFEDMDHFIKETDDGKWLVEENQHYVDYQKLWDDLVYADPNRKVPFWVKQPVFVTCDAVVVQSGHVLLVKRKEFPGKGRWALPGGFLNQYERIKDGIVRELREETMLKVPEGVIRGSFKHVHTFDNPKRSMRGRTVTHAAYIDLGNFPELPHVKGADDADKAEWIAFKDIRRDNMFEDHFAIISFFIGLE